MINPIIKIVTTVAILAAVGIFIVRPVLDTTEKAIDVGQRGRAQRPASRAASRAPSMDLSFSRSSAPSRSSPSLQSTLAGRRARRSMPA